MIPNILNYGNLVINENIINTIGINEAIVIGGMINLIHQSQVSEENYLECNYWVYKSYNNLQEEVFKYFSISTLKRIFTKLESLGILLKRNDDNDKFNRTLYTTIDFDKLIEIVFNKK